MSILSTSAETVTQKCLRCGTIRQIPISSLVLGAELGGVPHPDHIILPTCTATQIVNGHPRSCDTTETNLRLWDRAPGHPHTAVRNGLAAELKRRGQSHTSCKSLHATEQGAPKDPGRFPCDPAAELAVQHGASIADRQAELDAEVTQAEQAYTASGAAVEANHAAAHLEASRTSLIKASDATNATFALATSARNALYLLGQAQPPDEPAIERATTAVHDAVTAAQQAAAAQAQAAAVLSQAERDRGQLEANARGARHALWLARVAQAQWQGRPVPARDA